MDNETSYRKVTESIKLLSLPYTKQVLFFPDFVDVPFEILDTFDNAFYLLPNILDARRIKYEAISNVLRVHNLINFTSSNPDLKDLKEEQFENAGEWNIVRELAKETLQLMGEPLEDPDPNFI